MATSASFDTVTKENSVSLSALKYQLQGRLIALASQEFVLVRLKQIKEAAMCANVSCTANFPLATLIIDARLVGH